MAASIPPGASSAKTKQILVNEQDFVNSRNALITYLHQLSGAVKKTLEAYVNHSEVVLGGDFPLTNDHMRFIISACVSGAPLPDASVSVPDPDAEPAKRKRKKRVPRPEGKPKAPLTAALRYSEEQRPVLREKYGSEKTRGDIEKEMNQKWREMSQAEQQVYRDRYLADRVVYKEQMAKYKADLKSAGEQPNSTTQPAKPVNADDASPSSSDSSDSSDDEDAAPLPPPTATKQSKARGPRGPYKTKNNLNGSASPAKRGPKPKTTSFTPVNPAAAESSPAPTAKAPKRNREDVIETPRKEKKKRKGHESE